MPPRQIDVKPYVSFQQEEVIRYPAFADIGTPSIGSPLVVVTVIYQFGLGPQTRFEASGPEVGVMEKIDEILAPRQCGSVG